MCKSAPYDLFGRAVVPNMFCNSDWMIGLSHLNTFKLLHQCSIEDKSKEDDKYVKEERIELSLQSTDYVMGLACLYLEHFSNDLYQQICCVVS